MPGWREKSRFGDRTVQEHLGCDAGGKADRPVHREEAGFQVAIVDKIAEDIGLTAVLEPPGVNPEYYDVAFVFLILKPRREVSRYKLER